MNSKFWNFRLYKTTVRYTNESASTRAGAVFCGVADGARTHDNRNHNPGLYQLSYSHRRVKIITALAPYCDATAAEVGLDTLICAL
jgi:hypothetical protein